MLVNILKLKTDIRLNRSYSFHLYVTFVIFNIHKIVRPTRVRRVVTGHMVPHRFSRAYLW